MVQHLQIFDYVCLSSTILPGQFIEYVDEEHEHFTTQITIKNAKYIAPLVSCRNSRKYLIKMIRNVIENRHFIHV